MQSYLVYQTLNIIFYVVLSNCYQARKKSRNELELQIISLYKLQLSSANNPAQGGRLQAMITYAKARTSFREPVLIHQDETNMTCVRKARPMMRNIPYIF